MSIIWFMSAQPCNQTGRGSCILLFSGVLQKCVDIPSIAHRRQNSLIKLIWDCLRLGTQSEVQVQGERALITIMFRDYNGAIVITERTTNQGGISLCALV